MMTDGAITAEGLESLKAELAALEGPARVELAGKIKRARELGDLSENAEYHQAKEEQAHLETKILRLQSRLRNAIVVEAPAQGATVVAFGGTVTVADDETGKEMTYTLVGPTEADLKAGKLSSESPVAQALLGRAAGDVAEIQTPKGTRRWRVVKLG